MALPKSLVRSLGTWSKYSLTLLFALLLVLGADAGTEAHASTLTVLRSAADSVLAKKKKAKKKKAKKKKAKKKKAKKKPKAEKKVAAVSAVVVMPFEGDGGGQAMASQVRLGITSVPLLDSENVEGLLGSGAERFSNATVKNALDKARGGSLVRGLGRKHTNTVEIKLYVYGKDGQVHFSETYISIPGEKDPLSLAPQIGDDLDKTLPNIDKLPIVTGPETATWSEVSVATTSSNNTTTTNTTNETAVKSEQPSDNNSSKAEQRQLPFLSIGAGFELNAWSYQLLAKDYDSTVKWSPLEPFLGANVSASIWPVEWVGADLRLGFGTHTYTGSTAEPLQVNEDKIDVTDLDIAVIVGGRYLLDLGVGVGGHLAYRYGASFVTKQTPTMIAPAFAAHQLSPGLDLYFTALRPYLTAKLSADVIPWGMYAEAPDSPGDPTKASMWGWRIDGSVRSTVFMGVYVELSGFYGLNYINYAGQGTRKRPDGTTLSDSTVTNGLRGISIGAGWSF